MRILITGITGFVGGHLTQALHQEGGHAIVGTGRTANWHPTWAHLAGTADLHAVELDDGPGLERLIRAVRPDWVFHLAAFANAGQSFRHADACWRVNLDGTRALYDAIDRSYVRPRILFASTGLIYGDPDEPGLAFDESAVLKPASPYAASKAAADILSYQYTRSPGLDIVRVRLFNQIGPRQSADYATANFARQIAAAEKGLQPAVIETGDLSSERDITDIRDVVLALRLAIEKGASGAAYNAGTGTTWAMQAILDKLVAQSHVPVTVVSRAEPGRKADTARTRADARKLHAATGWVPTYELDRTLTDILEYWRSVTT